MRVACRASVERVMRLEDDLRRIDDSVERVAPVDPALSSWASNYGHHQRHRLAEDLHWVRRHVSPDARILEFGSIPPFLTLALQDLGYDIQGLDIAPERFAETIARHELRVHKIDFETDAVPFEDESFDVVLFNEVFEHLRIDLISTMTEVRRVIRPGGTLLLSTPNLRSVRGFWSLVLMHRGCHVGPGLYDEYEKLQRYGHMGHVREYTAREVSKFLAKIGFVTRQTIFRDYGPAVNQSPIMRVAVSLERLFCAVIPSLRPLFTLVCEKVARRVLQRHEGSPLPERRS